jgi:hypothetical protein
MFGENAALAPPLFPGVTLNSRFLPLVDGGDVLFTRSILGVPSPAASSTSKSIFFTGGPLEPFFLARSPSSAAVAVSPPSSPSDSPAAPFAPFIMFSTSFSTIPRRFAVVRPIVAATVSPPLALALAVPVVAVPPILSPRSPASRPAADAAGVVDPRRRFPAVVAARGASSSFKTSSSSNARSASSSSRRARARARSLNTVRATEPNKPWIALCIAATEGAAARGRVTRDGDRPRLSENLKFRRRGETDAGEARRTTTRSRRGDARDK